MASTGRTATEDAFILARAEMDRQNWNDTLTAPFFIAYLDGSYAQLSNTPAEPVKSQVKAWPNPTSGTVYFSEVEPNTLVKVIHPSGFVVIETQITDSKIELNYLPYGLYWLVIGGQRTTILKI